MKRAERKRPGTEARLPEREAGMEPVREEIEPWPLEDIEGASPCSSVVAEHFADASNELAGTHAVYGEEIRDSPGAGVEDDWRTRELLTSWRAIRRRLAHEAGHHRPARRPRPEPAATLLLAGAILLALVLGACSDPIRNDLIRLDEAMKPLIRTQEVVNEAIDRLDRAIAKGDMAAMLRILRDEIVPGHERMVAIVSGYRPATAEVTRVLDDVIAAERRQSAGFHRFADAVEHADAREGSAAREEITAARSAGDHAKAELRALGAKHGVRY